METKTFQKLNARDS